MPYPPRILFQIKQAFVNVFNIAELGQLYDGHVSQFFGSRFQNIINPSQFVTNDQLFQNVLEFVNTRDRLPEFVAAARAERPLSTDLMKAEELMSLSASSRIIPAGKTSVDVTSNLESQVQQVAQLVDIASFMDRVARIEPCVC